MKKHYQTPLAEILEQEMTASLLSASSISVLTDEFDGGDDMILLAPELPAYGLEFGSMSGSMSTLLNE